MWRGARGGAVRVVPLILSILLLPAASAVIALDGGMAIQPGSQVETPVGLCTLNYVFKDATRTYLGTAGHCVEGTGGRVSTPGAGTWGTVVVDIDDATDFALLRVDVAKLPLVRADVRHWGGPTGIATTADTAAGDVLAIYGYGMALDAAEPTRAKQGLLLDHSASAYVADTWAVFGDSGGPVLHKETGKALGIVSQFNLPVSTDIGPTLSHILQQLAQRGYQVQLQTASGSGALV